MWADKCGRYLHVSLVVVVARVGLARRRPLVLLLHLFFLVKAAREEKGTLEQKDCFSSPPSEATFRECKRILRPRDPRLSLFSFPHGQRPQVDFSTTTYT